MVSQSEHELGANKRPVSGHVIRTHLSRHPGLGPEAGLAPGGAPDHDNIVLVIPAAAHLASNNQSEHE